MNYYAFKYNGRFEGVAPAAPSMLDSMIKSEYPLFAECENENYILVSTKYNTLLHFRIKDKNTGEYISKEFNDLGKAITHFHEYIDKTIHK